MISDFQYAHVCISGYSPMDGQLGSAAPLLIGALWGVGDGVFNTQTTALLGLLFKNNKVIIFDWSITPFFTLT